MSDTPQDYYVVLGIPKTATQDEIKKVYRRLARKYHPDLHPGAKKAEMETKFKELNEAHDVLRNEDSRKKYDQYGFQWKEAEAYHHAHQQAIVKGKINYPLHEYPLTSGCAHRRESPCPSRPLR